MSEQGRESLPMSVAESQQNFNTSYSESVKTTRDVGFDNIQAS
jgi:hypothetical protein